MEYKNGGAETFVLFGASRLGSDVARRIKNAGYSLLAYADLDFPEKLNACHKAIVEVASLWSDFHSLKCYFEQIHHRMTLDPLRSSFGNMDDLYFDSALFQLKEDEVLVNCGAYNGDTIKHFIDKSQNKFKKIFAIEPDKRNFNELSETVKHLGSKIELIEAAAVDFDGLVKFQGSGDVQSFVTDRESGIDVCARTIDSIVKDEKVSLIQMDIEGSESLAIAGCKEVIRNHTPVLAICLYHNLQDLWEIPQQIAKLSNQYNYYLKRYSDDGWELVLYCIPITRIRA